MLQKSINIQNQHVLFRRISVRERRMTYRTQNREIPPSLIPSDQILQLFIFDIDPNLLTLQPPQQNNNK